MDKLRENVRAAHRQLEADLAAGDPKARGIPLGELNAARKALGMPPIPPTREIWIGSEFSAPNNGILILGESTYGKDPPLSEYIPSWCRGDQRDYTFSRIFNAFSGTKTLSASPTRREMFWGAVAFANFVQEPIGLARVQRPTTAIYRKAAASLPDLLERIKPKPRGVLILGTEQAEFSAPVIQGVGIPYAICPHPARRGVKTAALQAAWDELQRKILNAL